MNVLEFEVHNQILSRIDSQDVINENKNVYKCRFTFEEDSEWSDLNKFVIFQDGWGNSSTVHLGKSSNILTCLIPNKVLRGSYFQVSIYGGDLITTNTVSVALIHSGYIKRLRYSNRYPKPYHYPHHPHILPKPHLHKPCEESEGDIFVEIFNRLDNSVDSIVYDNHTLHLFNQDYLMESIYLPFISEEEFEGLVEGLVNEFINEKLDITPDEGYGFISDEDKQKLDSIEEGANKITVDMELDINSDNPIANKCVTEALNGKEDSYDIVERIDGLIIDLINEGE